MINIKYDIIFKGTSYERRMIEVYLPEYKHSQFAIPSPIGETSNIFGFISDKFWREHKELNVKVKQILTQLVYKHLWFIMGWDLAPEDKFHTFDAWKWWVNELIERYTYFKPNEQEYQLCLNSFYNKYIREKGKRTYNYIENEKRICI